MQQNNRNRLFLGAVLAIASAQGAHAQEESKLTINGRVWARYLYQLTKDTNHVNGFDLYRAYLGATYRFDDTWSAVVLLDAARERTVSDVSFADSSYDYKEYNLMYLRNAYVEARDVVGEGSKFRFGYQPTFLIASVDGATKTRWLAKSLADEFGLLTSQAGGASLSGKAGLLSYGAIWHNGREGLALKGNTDSSTTLGAYLGVAPIESSEGAVRKLGVHAYYEGRGRGGRTTQRHVLGSAVTLESAFLDGALELVWLKDKDADAVLSYGATLNGKFLEERASVFARFATGNDAFKAGSDTKWLLTVGPTYAVLKDKVSTALLFQTEKPEAGGNNTSTIFWNWAANF